MWDRLKRNIQDDNIVTASLFPTRKARVIQIGWLIVVAVLLLLATFTKDDRWSSLWGYLGICLWILWSMYWMGKASKYIIDNNNNNKVSKGD